MRPLKLRRLRGLAARGQLRLAVRVLPHVPAAGLAWLGAVGWAGRRRILGLTDQHPLWVHRPDGVRARGVLHPVAGANAALLAVGGSTGSLHGPGWIYPGLCARLQSAGISGLRLDYARPNHLEAYTRDVLAGIQFLEERGIERVVRLGRSSVVRWSSGPA